MHSHITVMQPVAACVLIIISSVDAVGSHINNCEILYDYARRDHKPLLAQYPQLGSPTVADWSYADDQIHSDCVNLIDILLS